MPDYKSVVVSTTDKKKNKKKKKENAALAIVKGLIPWKGDSVGEIIRKIVFLVSIVALCVAVLIIIDKYMFEPERQRNEYQSSILQLGNHEPTAEEIAELPEKAINTEYAPFYAINNDFVGWLSIKGINVNYPVVQGKNNADYLERIFTAITVRTVLFLRIMRTNLRIRAKHQQIRSFTVITCVPKTSLPK